MLAFKYHDKNVNLTDDGQFEVACLGRDYETAALAKAAIDRHVAAEKRVKKRKLSLGVVSDVLLVHELTGVHAATGDWLLTPSRGRTGGRFGLSENLYPDHAAVRALIKLRNETQDELRKMDAALDRVALSKVERHYRQSIDVEAATRELEADYKEKAAAVRKLGKRYAKR